MTLDPWQEQILRWSLRTRNGTWAANHVVVVCPRQNGKNAIIEARELAGLLLFDHERLALHSAHLADTATEAFLRLAGMVESNDWLNDLVSVRRANGQQQLQERETGKRTRWRARTRSGGRGYSPQLIVFDEAQELPDDFHSSQHYGVSAQPHWQIWYTGTAVDQLQHADGLVLTRYREDALAGGNSDTLYVEWSADFPNPEDVPPEALRDPKVWRAANPADRITIETVRKELPPANPPRHFAVERLGVGDWPSLDDDGAVISVQRWAQLLDERSRRQGDFAAAFEVSLDREWASIAIAGRRSDGNVHIELVRRSRGTDWVPGDLAEIATKKPVAVVCNGAGPAASLAPAVSSLTGTLSASDYAKACGAFFDAVQQGTIRHRGHPELESALRAAGKRSLAGAWAWSRRTAAADITPLAAATVAYWALVSQPPRKQYRAAGFS